MNCIIYIVQLVHSYRCAKICLGLIWFTIEVEGSFERGNELSVSIKLLEFIDWLMNCQLLKRGSAQRINWLQHYSEELDG